MDGIHSYEQRSSSEADHELDLSQNRVIIVDRHEPDYFASAKAAATPGASEARGTWLSWLPLVSSSTSTSARRHPTRGPTKKPGSSSSQSASKLDYSVSSSSSSYLLSQFATGPFCSNELRTSKYTLINFLPKNLFEQFRRLANFYFLTTAILQIITPFSPVGPATSLLPLMFVVSTTAIKQAYEDYLRHKLDKEVNDRQCLVLRNKRLIKIRSKDICVGDFVHVRNNEEIPCDMILLASGDGNGDRCYVTTANLDGETSLKSRTCFQVKERVGSIEKLDDTLLVVECDRPNATLYEFNGFLRIPKSAKAYSLLIESLLGSSGGGGSGGGPQAKRGAGGGAASTAAARTSGQSHSSMVHTIMRRIRQASSRKSISARKQQQQQQTNETKLLAASTSNLMEFHEIPLDVSNLLLRASRLRNTSHVYGLAIFTGKDTKLAHNSQVKPNKFSSTESKVNVFLIIAFLILALSSFVGALMYKRPNQWFFTGLKKADSFGEMLVSHFLLYNYLVPISLYVTLEFIKFLGTIAVVEDKEMQTTEWHSGTGMPASAESMAATPAPTTTTTIDQVENGKNGAGPAHATTSPLDQNPSTMSIKKGVNRVEGTKCNSSDLNEELGQVEVLFSDKTGTLTENRMRFTTCSLYGQIYRSLGGQLYLQPANLYQAPIADVASRLARVSTQRHALLASLAAPATSPANRSNSSGNRSPPPATQSAVGGGGGDNKPFDHRQPPPLSQMHLVTDMAHQERLVEFFICLCLCSTITLNESLSLADCLPNKTMNEYDFQSASPDEESLISAAHQFGVTMCKSNDRECFIVIKRGGVGAGSSSNGLTTTNSAHDNGSINGKHLAKGAPPPPPQPKAGQFKALVMTKHSSDNYIVRHFERLLVFEFTSVRKRMSVIYRDCDNDCLIMVSKGSEELLDCVSLERLSPKAQQAVNRTLAHYEAFAKSGLRTLLVGWRPVKKREFDEIEAGMKEARLSIRRREHLLNTVYRRAETGLRLIGTTAVEDTLQEGVPETIASLREAGIKVWLLTGDKVETAISVAYLCKLLERDMVLFHLVRQQDMQACKKLLSSYSEQINKLMAVPEASAAAGGTSSSSRTSFGRHHHQQQRSVSGSAPAPAKIALVADGRSLHYAMKYAKEELSGLCKQCACVLGCRLSPMQKAEVVDMIKQADERPITAAIGDGANDVSMIQEAHIGIGVRGKEGRQAVNCSDFAIGRFRMLHRLLFVHGHLFYHRSANTIHYFFYKNILFILPQFLYSFYNLSSGQSLYHPILLIGYNLLFTSLPILIYGLYEVHIPTSLLAGHPRLYKMNRGNKQMRLSVFFTWLGLGVVQALIGFYLLLYNWGSHTPFLESGKMAGVNGFSVVLYFVIIFTATSTLVFMAQSHNYCFILSIAFSCAILPIILYCYALADWSRLIEDNTMYGQGQAYFRSPMFWLASLTTSLATLVPVIVWYIWNRIDQFTLVNLPLQS